MVSYSHPTAPLAIQGSSYSEKARIFFAILNGQAASRREVGQLLCIRSTTVSERVGELLNLQLLTESIVPNVRRGRPSMMLVANPNRIVALVFQVISQALHVVSVNLAGQILGHEQIDAPSDCDNVALTERFRELHRRIIAKTPKITHIAGISFSLSGLIDASSLCWVFSSRWPLMRHLRMEDIFYESGCPIFICRAMDAELRARFIQESDSTLLFHWGYGIGIAFSGSSGQVAFGDRGFGEVGHWRIAGQESTCRCGRKGCLETTSALWALGPELLGKDFHTGDSEETTATLLQSMDLLAFPVIRQALDNVVFALGNLGRIFFPSRIVVSGPFVANAGLWSAFCEKHRRESSFVGLLQPELIAGERSREYEIRGAANSALENGLSKWLSAN